MKKLKVKKYIYIIVEPKINIYVKRLFDSCSKYKQKKCNKVEDKNTI